MPALATQAPHSSLVNLIILLLILPLLSSLITILRLVIEDPPLLAALGVEQRGIRGSLLLLLEALLPLIYLHHWLPVVPLHLHLLSHLLQG